MNKKQRFICILFYILGVITNLVLGVMLSDR